MHRTSPKSRSISVQRETLRVLAASELRGVAAGEVRAVLGSNAQILCRITDYDVGPIGGGGGTNGAGGCTQVDLHPETRVIINPGPILVRP
jgi:hypothetical protein